MKNNTFQNTDLTPAKNYFFAFCINDQKLIVKYGSMFFLFNINNTSRDVFFLLSEFCRRESVDDKIFSLDNRLFVS